MNKADALILITQMVENQNNLNTKSYSPEWVTKAATKEFDYPLAGAQEVSEFINSFGYSWWSKPAGNLATSPLDVSNCRTELVDAVHFMLSNTLQVFESTDMAAKIIQTNYEIALASHTFRSTRAWSRILGARLLLTGIEDEEGEIGRGYMSYDAWMPLFACAESMGFGLESLFGRYIGKSVLNAFRQENGYKQGTYKKLWDGLNEDNYFLADWIDSLEHTPSKEEIHAWLTEQYANHTQAA